MEARPFKKAVRALIVQTAFEEHPVRAAPSRLGFDHLEHLLTHTGGTSSRFDRDVLERGEPCF